MRTSMHTVVHWVNLDPRDHDISKSFSPKLSLFPGGLVQGLRANVYVYLLELIGFFTDLYMLFCVA
jgi:hypothetical protein